MFSIKQYFLVNILRKQKMKLI